MTTPYQAAVLADGPLALWPLTESSGSVAADVTGHGYDAAYPTDGSVSLGVAGPGDGCCTCVRFNDGTLHQLASVYAGLAIANAASLPVFPAQLTIEAWLKPEHPALISSGSAYFAPVVSWGADPSDSDAQPLWLLEARVWAASQPCALTYPTILQRELSSVGHLRPGGATTDCAPGGWTYGSWHHVALCLDRTTPANSGIYVDGVAYGGGLSQTDFSTMSGAIAYGAIGRLAGATYVGGMAYLALYTACLTSGRIAAHYAASVCGAVPDWVRLSHASGRGYLQHNGLRLEVRADDTDVLYAPLPVLVATPAMLVGKDPTSGIPAFCPEQHLPQGRAEVLTAPAVPTTTVDHCTQLRCGVADACTRHLLSLYANWARWLSPLFALLGTLGVAAFIEEILPMLLAEEASASTLAIWQEFKPEIQGVVGVFTGNLLPTPTSDLTSDIQKMLFCQLICEGGIVHPTATQINAWRDAFLVYPDWAISSLQGQLLELLTKFTPLQDWLIAAEGATTSSACDSWTCP